MDEAARALATLKEWESFYVIVGSSGAALTGLQFVVMALIAVRKTKYPSRNQRLRHSDSDSLLRGTAVVGNSQRTLARAVECGRRHGHVWIRGRCLWSNNNWAGTPADQLPAGI